MGSYSDREGSTHAINRWTGRFIFLLVMLVPVPLASNRPIIWALEAAVLGLATLAFLAAHGFRHHRWRIAPGRLRLPFLIVSLVGIATIVQAFAPVPMPLAPPVWADAARAGLAVDRGYLSVNPAMSHYDLLKALTVFLAFFLAVQVCRSTERANRLVLVVFVTVIGIAGYGLLVHLTGSNTILFMKKWAYEDAVTDTFVNRNAFASYCGVGLVCGIALVVKRLQRASDVARRRFKPGVSRRPVTFAMFDELLGPTGILLLGWSVILVAVIMTGSRFGAAASLAGVAAVLLMAMTSGRLPARIVTWPFVIAGVAIALVIGTTGDLLFSRLDGLDASIEVRAAIYRDVMAAIGERPLVGYGAGGFADAFAAFQGEEVPFTNRWSYAHNSYLELAFEFGLVVAVVLLLLLAALVAPIVGNALSRRDDSVAALAAAGALVVLGMHSLVDFPLQMQAVALTLAVLLAAARAQSGGSTVVRHGGAASGKARRSDFTLDDLPEEDRRRIIGPSRDDGRPT